MSQSAYLGLVGGSKHSGGDDVGMAMVAATKFTPWSTSAGLCQTIRVSRDIHTYLHVRVYTHIHAYLYTHVYKCTDIHIDIYATYVYMYKGPTYV